jgi:hypothetical protein
MLVGAYHAYRVREHRLLFFLLLGTAVSAYLFALGAAGTPFRSINIWIYEHIPFASGLRDSHKAAGLLGLIYALFAAVGFGVAVKHIRERFASYTPLGIAALFLLPIIFGMYMWGGFRGQLRPVWFPEEWYKAKAILDAAPPETKALILPWHGYFSLDFANQLIVANAAPLFFGHDRVVASKSAEIGTIYDQETGATYRRIDETIRSYSSSTAEILYETLSAQGIRYIFIVRNSAGSVARLRDERLRKYAQEPFVEPSLEGEQLFEDISGDVLVRGRIDVKHIAPR